MDQIVEMILEEYDEKEELLRQLEKEVKQRLNDVLVARGVSNFHITHRVKDRESLKGKLIRKSGKYRSIFDLTDLVGFRVICYFSDRVDESAAVISESFDIDWNNSCDKRTLIAPEAFGYLSLHYICHLPKGCGYSDELCEIPFEIQLRSMLQHTWAEIEHDLGYKTELAVPREVRRDFARVASLLEVADSYFLMIKNKLADYEVEVDERVREDKADDMNLNRVTLNAFMESNSDIRRITQEIASISGAEIIKVSYDHYLPLLKFLGVETIGDLKKMASEQGENAVAISRKILEDSEIDELISSVSLYYLCRATLIYVSYTKEQIIEFYKIDEKDDKRAERKAEYVIRQKNKIANTNSGG